MHLSTANYGQALESSMHGLSNLAWFSPLQMPTASGVNLQVEAQYYPIAEELLRRETGATRVKIFDHTLRQGHVR